MTDVCKNLPTKRKNPPSEIVMCACTLHGEVPRFHMVGLGFRLMGFQRMMQWLGAGQIELAPH
jgi:hypothetical protein